MMTETEEALVLQAGDEDGELNAVETQKGTSNPPEEHAHYAESLAAFLSTISRRSLLSPSAERSLARRVVEGCPEAKKELLERNLRLVVHNVKRYRGLGLDFEELLQEGVLGLIRAAEKFDPEAGYKFSTYATWWIRQKASRAIFDKGRAIRIPVHYQEQIRKLRDTERSLTAAKGREPSTEEIADELEVGAEKVREMAHTRQSITSLDATVTSPGKEQGSALGEFLADEELQTELTESVEMELDHAGLRRAIGELFEPHRSVLILRYGLDGEESRSLQQVGDWLGVSREVARQYQKRAEKQLKSTLSGRGAA